MPYNFRKITYDDIEAAYALECACFSRPWPKSALTEIVEKKDADYYLAEDTENGRLAAGCVIFHILDEGDISNVAADPDYRGQGITTNLLKYAIDCGERDGILDFTLEVRKSNAPALRVYEKCGFKSVGIRPGFYSAPKEDAVVMWRYHDDEGRV